MQEQKRTASAPPRFWEEVKAQGAYKILLKVGKNEYVPWRTSIHRNGKQAIDPSVQKASLIKSFVKDYLRIPHRFEYAVLAENTPSKNQKDVFLGVLDMSGNLSPLQSKTVSEGVYTSKFRVLVRFNKAQTEKRLQKGKQACALVYNIPEVDDYNSLIGYLGRTEGITEVLFWENKTAQKGSKPIAKMDIQTLEINPYIY